jgi:ABC-2 type transport system permease protein
VKSLGLSLRLFLESAWLSYLGLFAWLRPATYLASKIIMPLAQILFFSLIGMFASGSRNVSFYVIGNSVQILAVSAIFGVTMSVGGERWSGTLAYLFATPANRLILFVGRAFMHVLDGMLGVLFALGWGVVLFGLDLSHTSIPAFALTLLITTISTSGLGLLMGCLSLTMVDVMFINNTVYFALLIFSGANVPLSSMPTWMRAISSLLPLTRGLQAARLIIAGDPLSRVLPLLAGELLVGVAYLLVGYLFFRWFEFQARRRGTLEAV